MNPLTADEIRASFANCSKGEAKRAALPDLDAAPWPDLDFLGWPDPSGSQRAYLVLERLGVPTGLLLRQSSGVGATRSAMCQICITSHSGGSVALSVARKTGAAGKKGDSTGIYICRDLACSLYVRGKKVSGAASLARPSRSRHRSSGSIATSTGSSTGCSSEPRVGGRGDGRRTPRQRRCRRRVRNPR